MRNFCGRLTSSDHGIPTVRGNLFQEVSGKLFQQLEKLRLSSGKFVLYVKLEVVTELKSNNCFSHLAHNHPIPSIWGNISGKEKYENQAAIPCNYIL
jgi:hypothetical protein